MLLVMEGVSFSEKKKLPECLVFLNIGCFPMGTGGRIRKTTSVSLWVAEIWMARSQSQCWQVVCYSEFKQVTLQETCIIFPQNRKQITELMRHVWLTYKYMERKQTVAW